MTEVPAQEGEIQYYTTGGVTSGTYYAFSVLAMAADGESLSEQPISESFLYLASPVIQKVSLKSRGPEVEFRGVNGGEKYRIFRTELKDGMWTDFLPAADVENPGGKEVLLTWQDRDVVPGGIYRYSAACVIGEDGTTGILGNGSVVVCYTG